MPDEVKADAPAEMPPLYGVLMPNGKWYETYRDRWLTIPVWLKEEHARHEAFDGGAVVELVPASRLAAEVEAREAAERRLAEMTVAFEKVRDAGWRAVSTYKGGAHHEAINRLSVALRAALAPQSPAASKEASDE